LLEQHGIDWRIPLGSGVDQSTEPERETLSPDQKLKLFRRLFLGRTDVYPVRWENQRGDRSGYTPACANEWRVGVCEKPRIKCSDCQHRQLIPLSDQIVFDHLAGKQVLGVYPLLTNNTCHFLAVDFDKSNWQDDVQAFAASCRAFEVPVSVEISRSGDGAHAWIFFDRPVLAREARQLGTALISHTCASTRQLDLASYDRLFPNQDTLPKGGFGNLIALPLQKVARERGCSVFVDTQLEPIDDQWQYLKSVEALPAHAIEATVLRASGSGHALDLSFIDEEDQKTPWIRPLVDTPVISSNMPASVNVTLSDMLYIEKAGLPRIIRLAAFQNPEFYKAQAMRFSVWNKPRVIGCADNYPFHIALPRGCLEPLCALFKMHQVDVEQCDERYHGNAITAVFSGVLHPDQYIAVTAMLAHDTGILCAPTAFGKTVVAAAMIAQRGVNTLILVHRAELLEQWLERLRTFLAIAPDAFGRIGGGKKKVSGKIDIALVQSLSRKGSVDSLVETYGHVIIDECHHVGALSVEAILKRVKAKYVTGLTATPIRRDGQQPIIYMQCGPIRHTAERSADSRLMMMVKPHLRDQMLPLADDASIQTVFGQLVVDQSRTRAIASLVLDAWRSGRKVLVLTERTDHLHLLQAELSEATEPYVLHGRISKKQRTQTLNELQNLPPDKPRILLATGKLVGEGFDHSALDTLVLAMPVSWKGTLQQYVGRLHRVHQGKVEVTVIDVADLGHPALVRMWERRQKGYQSLGYTIAHEK